MVPDAVLMDTQEELTDLLDRKAFVARLIDVVEILSENRKNASFAVNGAWGVGKTFVLNRFEEEIAKYPLEKDGPRKYLVFHYDCWKYDYYEEPLIALVAALTDSIDKQTNFISADKRTTFKVVLKEIIAGLVEVGSVKTGFDIKKIFETIKKEYVIGIDFRLKQSLSSLQMAAYSQELRRLGIQIENIFQWFFEEYLRTNFGANGFTYFPPSSGTSFAEKCKLMCSAIDGILKQYRLYCEDGFVDRELLEMSSGHVVFSEIPSMIRNKYAYAASETVQSEMFLLFSDQSMMNYTEKTRSKYQTLPELLLSEKMKKEDFRDYQRKSLDWLLEHSDLAISEDGYITIEEKRVSVLKDLFVSEVICPIYYGSELREQVDILAASGDLRYKGTLFSGPEQDYLNFMLNKAEFSNGFDLRNRYIHDTCTLNEEMQQQDYLELLKIMALIIIKINEEFCKKTKIGTD